MALRPPRRRVAGRRSYVKRPVGTTTLEGGARKNCDRFDRQADLVAPLLRDLERFAFPLACVARQPLSRQSRRALAAVTTDDTNDDASNLDFGDVDRLQLAIGWFEPEPATFTINPLQRGFLLGKHSDYHVSIACVGTPLDQHDVAVVDTVVNHRAT